MTKKQKRLRNRILVSAALFFVLIILDKTGKLDMLSADVLTAASGGTGPAWVKGLLYLVPYLIVGYDILLKAFKNIRNGQVFDECFLMMVATAAAFAIGENAEACAVMLFYQIGELFQSCAVGRSRQSIADMMSIAPESANLEAEDGTVDEVDPDEVEPGSVILIRPGERIPLDGEVIEGESFLDTAALTGESLPRRVKPGDQVISGCLNGDTALRVRTTKAYEDSTVAKILELVETASEKKARLENFITRFARWYTPAVTVCAALLALIPPLLLGQPFGGWVKRACIFLIVSCPCALVISVPLGFFGGIGAASKIGVLVKGSSFLESLAEMTTIVFDKTGTLTRGEFRVTKVRPSENAVRLAPENAADLLLDLAAHGEALSTHPIARSVREAYGKEPSLDRVSEVKEVAGRGIRALVDGKQLLIGSTLHLSGEGISFAEETDPGTVLYISLDGEYMGSIVISDTIKEGAAEALRSMKKAGITKTVMLTGDRKKEAAAVAEALGIDEYHSELLPADKVARVEKLLAEAGSGESCGKVGFVGDGLNDAPVLMRADVGIAMGSLGSDAAIEAADIVLMDDDIRKIGSVVRISRKTLGIVRQNVVFALAVKFAVLLLGAFGLANMWEAVFGDVGVTVIAILNSMRALEIPRD